MKKNIIWLILVQCSNYVFPLITLPYLLRVLGAHEYGIYTLMLAYTQYILLVVDYGFNFTATRLISKTNGSNSDIRKIFFTTLTAKIFLAFTACGLGSIIFLLMGVPPVFWKYGGFALLAALGNALYPLWLYQGIQRMAPISVSILTGKSIITAATFCFVKSEHDVGTAIFINSLTFLLPGIFLTIFAQMDVVRGFYRPTVSDVIEALKDGFPLFISTIATSFYTTFNIVLLGAYSTQTSVGSYGAADKVRVAAQGMFLPFTQAIFPRICVDSDRAGMRKRIIRYGIPFFSMGIAMTAFIYIFGKYISLIYFGKQNYVAATYFQKMAPLPMIVCMAIIFGQWYMIGRGFNKALSVIYVCGSLIHLLYVVPAVKFFGVLGVIYSVIATETLLTAAMIIFFITQEFKKQGRINK
ncbi:oligosaccharide flippase family protein [Paraburkholderia metrosideri]|uniref:Oligosaccharide flippase family protein n=1 Tax=Paraburkholderia metrosideri TaxID=580937 RepID=A0ABW9E0G3_9BURK